MPSLLLIMQQQLTPNSAKVKAITSNLKIYTKIRIYVDKQPWFVLDSIPKPQAGYSHWFSDKDQEHAHPSFRKYNREPLEFFHKE